MPAKERLLSVRNQQGKPPERMNHPLDEDFEQELVPEGEPTMEAPVGYIYL